MGDRRMPLESFAWPTLFLDWWAGSQTSLPDETIVDTSSPTNCAMSRQILPSTLSGPPAIAVPTIAAESNDWQSVRTLGMKSFSSSTVYSAQASAAAAVLHLAGGRPEPNASKEPEVETAALGVMAINAAMEAAEGEVAPADEKGTAEEGGEEADY